MKRPVRLGYVPRRRPSGEQGSILLVNPAWAAVRRAGLDPMRPVPGPGTGPSSFLGKKHWKKPDYAFQYPSPGGLAQGSCRHSAKVLAKCCLLLTKTLSAVLAPESSTSSIQSLGWGFHLGWGSVGSAPCASMVRGSPAAGRVSITPTRQQFPRGRSGERSLDPHGAGPGGQGSRPQVSRQGKRWKSQTTHPVSGPGRPAARLLEASPANHLPGLRWDLPGIYQPAWAGWPSHNSHHSFTRGQASP